MRCHDADEFAGCDDLGHLPEPREMPLVSGHQLIGAGSVGALQELVAVGVRRHLERAHRADRL